MRNDFKSIFKLESFWVSLIWLLMLIWALMSKDPAFIGLSIFWMAIEIIFLCIDIYNKCSFIRKKINDSRIFKGIINLFSHINK